MNKICVYSGSNSGNNTAYKDSAIKLGNILAEKNIELIYGGSNVGLMGAIANQVLKAGGKVTGIMPKNLFPSDIINQYLTNLIKVKDMHERKKTMSDLADGFIAMPGGIGTYEEVFEVLSWAQLGIHNKPIGLLNIAGFFEPTLKLLHNTVKEGFMNERNLNLFIASSNPLSLLEQMEKYNPPVLETKWIELENRNRQNNNNKISTEHSASWCYVKKKYKSNREN